MITNEELCKLTIEEAAKSTAKKRKVGAIIYDKLSGNILGKGYNYNTNGDSCEDASGKTLTTVIHAEDAAIKQMKDNHYNIENSLKPTERVIYVSYEPCVDCATKIKAAGINEVVIVGNFMKFDASKPRYELIPPVAMEGLADVLTYGAKKYKKDNWKNCAEKDRYIGAMMRHIESYRKGELVDPESGLTHLAHAMTNIAFLMHFDEQEDKPKSKIDILNEVFEDLEGR